MVTPSIDAHEEAKSGLARGVGVPVLILCALALLPVWLPDYLPLQDVPNHLLKVDILGSLMWGDTPLEDVYKTNLRLLPNWTFYVVTLALRPVFGLTIAAKLFASLYIVGLTVATYLWLGAVNPKNTVLCLAAPALAFNVFFLKGMLNFSAALVLYVAALTIFVEGRRPLRQNVASLALVSGLLYFTHGIVFATLVWVVLVLLMVKPSRRRVVASLGLLPGAVLSAAALVSAVARGAESLAPAFSAPELLWWSRPMEYLVRPQGPTVETALNSGWLVVIALLVIYSVVALAQTLLRQQDKWLELVRDNEWMVATLALALVYFLAPGGVRDWSHLQARFIPLTILTALGGVRLPWGRRFRTVVAVLLVVSSLSVVWRNGRELLQADRGIKEYTSGLPYFVEGSSLLPLHTGEMAHRNRFNLHSWSYYHLARGGWGPYLHAYSLYHPIVYTRTPWSPGLEAGGLPPETLSHVATCYDYLLLWKRADVATDDLGAYFRLEHRTEHLSLWKSRNADAATRTAACRQQAPDPPNRHDP